MVSFSEFSFPEPSAKKPDLLVLDEPVQGVDNSGEEAMYNLIETMARLSTAESPRTHDLHFVMSATTHDICLNGHICCSGTPEPSQRRQFPHLKQKYLPNLAIYEHMHDPPQDRRVHEKLKEMVENSNDNKEITTNA